MAEAKKAPTKKTTTKEVGTNKKVAKKEVKIAEQVAVKETTKKVKELVETEAVAEAIVEAEKEIEAEEKVTAKAGKRSAKAIKETKEKVAKEVRKSSVKTDEPAKKPAPKTRSLLDRKPKKYREIYKLIDKSKDYSLQEASDLICKLSPVKFDATVEAHIRLGVDPKQADQNVRASLVLPAGTGKTIRVAVVAEADKLDAAKKAGADIALSDDFFALLDKEKIDFDLLIATPSMMPKLGKYARLLGPKGLMPNPKSGTVATDVAKAVEESKAGKVEYRVDQNGIVHLAIGKVSFGGAKIRQNLDAFIASIKSVKPASIKGTYVKSLYVTTAMGPSLKITLSDIA